MYESSGAPFAANNEALDQDVGGSPRLMLLVSPTYRRACPGKRHLRKAFQSILYQDDGDAADLPREAPEYCRDLNLDQIANAITAHKDEHDLKPFFYDALRTIDAISYRHEVMRDLENDRTLRCLNSFAQKIGGMREKIALANKLYYAHQKQRWFLQAVDAYCAAIHDLQSDLSGLPLSSRGLLAFRSYLTGYAASARFSGLAATVRNIKVFFVTHQYEFARCIEAVSLPNVAFLRAERDGTRTFRINAGRPLPTSYGEELYQQIFV